MQHSGGNGRCAAAADALSARRERGMPDRFSHEEHEQMLNHVHEVFAENKHLLSALTEAKEDIRRLRAELRLKKDDTAIQDINYQGDNDLHQNLAVKLESINAEIIKLKEYL